MRYGLNDLIPRKAAGNGSERESPHSDQSALATFDAIHIRCEKMPIDQVALELRRYMWDACENLAASMNEDGFTVTKTWTPKGLRYFLAEREFLESLLSDDDAPKNLSVIPTSSRGKHLRKAENLIAEAKGLAETLRCALRSDDYNPEPWADVIAGSIVDLLGKAEARLDRHDMERRK